MKARVTRPAVVLAAFLSVAFPARAGAGVSAFLENQGQFGPVARHAASASGFAVVCTDSALVLCVRDDAGRPVAAGVYLAHLQGGASWAWTTTAVRVS